MSELSIGTVVRLKNGKTCRVKKELGRGGQGIVYLVDYGGKDFALKWYIAPSIIKSDAFFENLNRNVNAGSPAPNFVWPLAIAERQQNSYGYLMDLRPNGYEDMGQFILGHAKFASPKPQINACLQICAAFQRLHILGYSYQDMNDGNFFINPNTGDILICDNDNVAPDKTNTGIAGKAGYMAPEIVQGLTYVEFLKYGYNLPKDRPVTRPMPNKYTDYYSLAVCLFILIYMNRPFEGEHYLSCPCDNNPEMAKKLLGYESVFIMDPTNLSNRPVRGIHKNVIKRWMMYPALLGNAFCKTFSKEAIQDPTKRLMDKQWYNILLQIRSNYAPCPSCGKHTFLDSNNPQKICVYCQKSAPSLISLKVSRYAIPLVANQIIYDCQVNSQTDYQQKAGEVAIKNGTIGLVNRSKYPWTVTLPNGEVKIVAPDSGMPIKPGFKIKFGNQGETGELI